MPSVPVEAACAILKEHDSAFVVVGGQAVARTVPTGTMDVDVMVTTADFGATLALLLKDPRLRLRGVREGVAMFAMEEAGGIGFDLLDAAPFAGRRSGKAFFRFLVDTESTESGGVRYASTAIVWYTRLLTSRWKVYAEKILVNISDGADAGLLRRVEDIARLFGSWAEVEPRLRYVRNELAERANAAPPGRPGGSRPRSP